MFIFNEKIIEEIRKLSDKDIDEYILSKIDELQKNATENRKFIAPDDSSKSGLSHGFIPKEAEIYAESGMGSIAVGGFQLSDNDIYEILIKHLKSQEKMPSFGDVLKLIQDSIDEYFGGLALAENEINRRNLYIEMQEKYDICEPYPISEYRNNNTALCAERAAIAQNMLAFLGADTYYMMGHLSRNDGMANMNHAYNCIVDKEYGSGIVVDFTNPILRETSNEMYVYHSNIVNKDLISEFLSGEYQVEMDRPEFYMQGEKEIRRTAHCNYSLNSLSKQQVDILRSKKSLIEEIETPKKDTRGNIQEQLIGKSQAQVEREQKDKEAEQRTEQQIKDREEFFASTVEETTKNVRTESINKQARDIKQIQNEREQGNLSNEEKKERSALIAKQKFKTITPEEQLRLNELQQKAQIYNNNQQSKKKNKGLGIGE